MRIGLCGTMSTGKSTLTKELSKYNFFTDKYKFFTERSKELMAMGIPLNQSSTYKGQLVFFAERASELINKDFVTDRTVLDVYAFSEVSKHITPAQKKILKQIKDSLIGEYDMLFYVPISIYVPIEDNGIRETNKDYRKIIDKSIKKQFDAYKGPKHIVKANNIKDRIAEMINKLNEVRHNVKN